MEVPLARGLATRTTIWTEPEAPAARLPGDQVTTPEARVPPAVAETKGVLAGTVSVRTTPEVGRAPGWEKEKISVGAPSLKKKTGESVLETPRTGADQPLGGKACPGRGPG